MQTIIEVKKLSKTYYMGEVSVYALREINFSVKEGEFLAIIGASGSGKSTLMNLLGCLDTPTSGEYFLAGKRVDNMSKNELADVRNQKIGFIFQNFNLLPRTTAIENVELPLLYDRNLRIKHPQESATQALRQVGLEDRMSHVPSQLSGGEQQRVAIARALVNRPAIILADEPTGNLDTKTSWEIMSIFKQLNEKGITIILVTHEQDIAKHTKRIVELRDGKILKDLPSSH